MKDLSNIRFVFYTNQNNIALLELTLKHFFRHNSSSDVKVSVVSNNYIDNTRPYNDRVEYLSGDESFQINGGHFAKTMIKCLPLIKEKYIFFMCDDYFFLAETKYKDLLELLTIIDTEKVDYFGFDELASNEFPYQNYKLLNSNSSDFYKQHLFYRNSNYRYLFSIQPSIWNKSCMLEIVSNYPNLSLHGLDETQDSIKATSKYKSICCTLDSHFSFIDLHNDYFVIAYCELSRHGAFYIPENGYPVSSDYTSVKFIRKLIIDESLENNLKFRKLLHYVK